MFAALLLAGADRGQLRPGLAKAVADGRLTPDLAPDLVVTAKPDRMVMAATPVVKADPKPVTEVVPAAFTPVPEVAVPRAVVQAVKEPVFTLSSLPTEEIPAAGAQPETTAEGQIWYVTAASVNVREGPSTTTPVLGKLAAGEAALVVQDVDGEWARIVIQGDGMEGYVALRFLSATSP